MRKDARSFSNMMNVSNQSVWAVLVVLFSVIALACGQDDAILGCGGFVQASQELAKWVMCVDGTIVSPVQWLTHDARFTLSSHCITPHRVMTKKMDFSNIKVKLVTSDGVLKASTECAPNGYYFLPIYDKGKFAIQLESPQGWSFGKCTHLHAHVHKCESLTYSHAHLRHASWLLAPTLARHHTSFSSFSSFSLLPIPSLLRAPADPCVHWGWQRVPHNTQAVPKRTRY